jgi:hypothetical protein
MSHATHFHAVYADMVCAEAGSVWDENKTIGYFETKKATEEFIAERKRAAELTAEKESEIILRVGYPGGVPYVFQYVYMLYPKSEFPAFETMDTEFRSTLAIVWDYVIEPTQEELKTLQQEASEFDTEFHVSTLPFKIEKIPYLVEADRIVFEMPENW